MYARPGTGPHRAAYGRLCRHRPQERDLQTAAATDVGHVRSRNEDAYLEDPERGLVAVADGLGGHVGGHVASRTALEAVDDHLTPERLRERDPMAALTEALQIAHRSVMEAARRDPALRGMGTTAVLAHLGRSDHTATLAHVGDSRGYVLRGERLCRVTEDHVRTGVFGRSLTQALGTEAAVEPEAAEVSVRPGDRILLCTDGLTDMLADAEIATVLREDADEETTCRALIDAALARGGVDNVTVAVTTVRDATERAATGASVDRGASSV